MRRPGEITRRATLAGLSAVASIRPAAADTLYFPPGSRLGIAKPDGLVPFMGDPRNLQPADYTFKVEFSEPPRFGDEQDARIWNGKPDTRRLWETRLGRTTSGGSSP